MGLGTSWNAPPDDVAVSTSDSVAIQYEPHPDAQVQEVVGALVSVKSQGTARPPVQRP